MTFEEDSWKVLDTISSDMLSMENMTNALTEKEYGTFSEALAASQQITVK